jgi:OFA family oxalate/formate antiporter-like MFS transporter
LPIRNRWAIAAGGTAAMACLGTVYSWSLFTQPLVAAFGWSTTGATLAFSFAIFFLGVGAVIGGRWQDRAGPRPVAVSEIGRAHV